jgi:hypothetical protein
MGRGSFILDDLDEGVYTVWEFSFGSGNGGDEDLHAAPRNARSMNPDEKISQNDLLVSHGLLTVANW